jgi:CcmE
VRFRVVVLLVLITGSLVWVGTQALSGNLVYHVTPTELLQQHPAPDERLRLAGQVVPGSVHDAIPIVGLLVGAALWIGFVRRRTPRDEVTARTSEPARIERDLANLQEPG